MIVAAVYEVDDIEVDHNGGGQIISHPIDMSQMNIPDGIDPNTYTVLFEVNRNTHEFSSMSPLLSIRLTITDDESNTSVLEEAYYGNFKEIE